jgi:hypothetical protein
VSGHRVTSGSNPSYNLSRFCSFHPYNPQPPPPCPSAPRRRSPEPSTAPRRRSPKLAATSVPPPSPAALSRTRRLLHSARAAAACCAATAAPRHSRHRRKASLLLLPETVHVLRPVPAIAFILDLRPSRVALTLGFILQCRFRSSSKHPSRDVFAPRLLRTSLIFVLGFVEILFSLTLIDFCFGESALVRCVGKSCDLGHLISSPLSRQSEVAIMFRFTSYLICLLSLGFRTF